MYELELYNQRIREIHDVLLDKYTGNRRRPRNWRNAVYKELKFLCNTKYKVTKRQKILKPILDKNALFWALPEEILDNIIIMSV